jgi:hypothetical protein
MSIRRWRLTTLALGLLAAGAGVYVLVTRPTSPALPAPPSPRAAPAEEVSTEQARLFCGSCHAYAPPDVLPRAQWRREVSQMYEFFWQSRRYQAAPSLEGMVRYYEGRAPAQLPLNLPTPSPGPPPVRFEAAGYPAPQPSPHPAIAHLTLGRLTEKGPLDLLACDMRFGQVLALRPSEKAPALRVLARAPHPSRVEVVDLDGDGVRDLLVANLGSFHPTDLKVGSVLWLRGSSAGELTPVPLLENVGRVADVRAADFDGDGRLDLVVAVFGWRQTGAVLYLKNRTDDWSRPQFVTEVVDDRHGAIHVPVADLNGDGLPDFVALISQEHEVVVAFLNEGGGRFRKETLYAASHPTVGSTGIEVVDLDGDKDFDVLLTTGDVEPPLLLPPYHGVHWLENRKQFPFTHHFLAALHGAHRAVAADFDGDADLDVAAVSYLPAEGLGPRRQEHQLDAVILLEQTARGQFARHSVQRVACDHATCVAGDLFGDGKAHLVTGNFCVSTDAHNPLHEAVTIWRNQGAGPFAAPKEQTPRPR